MQIFKFIYSLWFFLIFLMSCQSYQQQSIELRQLVFNHKYEEAIKKINENDVLKGPQNKVLYQMEKGMVHYLNKNYKDAAKEWYSASKNIEKLYTISVSKQASSLVINDSVNDYEGEYHEKILLNLFSNIAYLADNQIEEAIVESRRSNSIINKSEDKKELFNRHHILLFYINGLTYEIKEELDSAIISYENALKASLKSTKVQQELIASSLLRVAFYRNRNEIIARLKEQFPNIFKNLTPIKNNDPELIIFFETGRAPMKIAKDFFIPIQDQIVRISFPIYENFQHKNDQAKIYIDEQWYGNTIPFSDIDQMARESLENRRVKDSFKMGLRALTKGQINRMAGKAMGPLGQITANIIGTITETADTRSWSLLPASVQVLKVPLTANKNFKIKIMFENSAPEYFDINLKPGEKRIIRSRNF